MLIGVPKEIKAYEYRVGLAPESVKTLISHGHRVIVQKGAGEKVSFTDHDYQQVGASIVDTAEEVYQQAEMIVKVKEPQPDECLMLRPKQILFAYLHLAPDPVQTKLLMESGCIAIAYETVTNDIGGLPLLSPMSEIAGKLSIQAGATCLEVTRGGRGVLLGSVTGVAPANVLVLGGGVAGCNAVQVAMGMGANVTVMDRSLDRLKQLTQQFGPALHTVFSTQEAVEEQIANADLIVGAVLIPGASAPRLITKSLLGKLKNGAVLVDISIDQGGCFETSKPTTHHEPTYIVDGIVHYCVANMPSAVPRTATLALNNATLPFTLEIANLGYRQAMLNNPHLLNGLNIFEGKVAYQAVADALNLSYTPANQLLGAV